MCHAHCVSLSARPRSLRGTFQLLSAAALLLSTLAWWIASPLPERRVHAAAAPHLAIAALDTMKESRDTETRPLTDGQIAATVRLAASLGVTHITVDTHWDYPEYLARWVRAVRASGAHVWFRIHPNQWGNNNGTSGIMTPAAYEASERALILSHPALFAAGDILDPCPEPENGLYWRDTYGPGWTAGAPNQATREYNAFIRDTTAIADSALAAAGVAGVTTRVRSINGFFATHAGPLEPETVAMLGRITVDSYPDSATRDPAVAAAAWLAQLAAIWRTWRVPVVIGEMGYSRSLPVDDATQAAVLSAEFAALGEVPYLAGLNYWVGAGTDASGGYTHVFGGTHGAWTLRPAARVLARFLVGTATAAPASDGASPLAQQAPGAASAVATSLPTQPASPAATAMPAAPVAEGAGEAQCPSGWRCADIGKPALAGSQSVAGTPGPSLPRDGTSGTGVAVSAICGVAWTAMAR